MYSSVTLTTRDPVDFESVDSHRARLGIRLQSTAHRTVNPYAGIGYEHEFAGRAQASTYGFGIAAPSLRGGAVTAEAGLSLQSLPSSVTSLPLTADLGIQAYAGKREGIAGNPRVGLEF